MQIEDVYIVGCGPSLKDFPFDKLREKNTIAVNMASLDVPDPTYCITLDSGILRKIQSGYFKAVRTTWVLVTNPCSMAWRAGRLVHIGTGQAFDLSCVNIVVRNAGVEGIGFSFADFRTGYNSGFCALQFALLLGYKRIFLLGIDLTDCGGVYHYSSRYHNQAMNLNELNRFFVNFVAALGKIREQTEVKVVSCSAISRLNEVIDYVPFEGTI